MIKKLAHFGIFTLLVTHFCTLSASEYSVGLLYLRPGGSNDYAVLVDPFNPGVPAPIISPSWNPKGIDADFNPGFSLNFRQIFPRSSTHLNFYWAHLHTSDGDTFPVDRQPPPAQQMTGPFWNIGPDGAPTSYASGQLKNHFDVLHAEVGKYLSFEPDLKMRLFGGLSALWLNNQIIANFAGIDPILGYYTFGINTQSKYNSVGMRLGLESVYKGWCGINMIGSLAGNLYVGSQQPLTEAHGTGSILQAAGVPENHQSIFHRSYIQLVPALDAKLGLQYSRRFANQQSLSLEAGYMASIYVNALQNYVPSTYVPGSLAIVSGSMYLQSLIKTTESFSLDGFYANFTYNFL